MQNQYHQTYDSDPQISIGEGVIFCLLGYFLPVIGVIILGFGYQSSPIKAKKLLAWVAGGMIAALITIIIFGGGFVAFFDTIPIVNAFI